MGPADPTPPLDLQNLLPPSLSITLSPWQPQHMDDPPEPPPLDNREAELAALAAQEKLGHDGKRQRVRPRRTVDPFGGLERWKIVRSFLCGGRKELMRAACSSGRPRPTFTMSCS